MNKFLISSALLGLAYARPAEAHKEWVHQYMVQQAYLFLQNQLGPVPALQTAIGLGFHGAGVENIERPDNQISIGAWREDVDDWVYGYNSNYSDGATPSITHFWKADGGDEEQSIFLPQSTSSGHIYNQYYENAWQKARILLFCRNPTNGIRSITVPYSVGNSITRYVITYTSLPELYKGNYWLEGASRNGTYTDLNHAQMTNNTSFGQPVALNILGRVAHLLGDMSVPAHAHAHIHPCPLGLPDYYENNMGGVWSSHNTTADCEDDPGGYYPAQNWGATTATQQGGFLSDIFCQSSPLAQMRYLFYTMNQLTDYFPSGVNSQNAPNTPPTNRNYLVPGNSDLPNGSNPYLQSRYQILQARLGGPPSYIVQQDVADETFNGSVRAVATLFQWFAFESGMMPTLDNNTIVSTSGDYLLCPGPPASTLTFNLSHGGNNVTWSVEPADMATGALTSSGYVVTPTQNYSIANATVKATLSTTYGACQSYSATLTKPVAIGATPLGMVTPDPAVVYEVEPGAAFELDAPNPNFPTSSSNYSWSSDNGSSVGGFGTQGQAYVTAPYTYSTEFHVTVNAANGCGPTTAARSFRTRDEQPPRCPGCDAQTNAITGGRAETPTTKIQPAGFEVLPNPTTGDFDIYYVRAKHTSSLTNDTPTFTNTPTFTLLDITGRTVITGNLPSPTTHIITNQLSAGVYMLKILDHSQARYKRIQVTR